MNTNTPPIIRGEFVYHNLFLVDVGGDLKRHARASHGDIKTLLDGKTPKDQIAHFYEAQLIHYGLQRSKDKNTAKVRLRQALNQKKLVVPAHIVDMEGQMKKEFAASVRKANRSATTGKAADSDLLSTSGAAAGKKRKQSEGEAAVASKKTRITMKVDDVEFSIDHDSNEISGATSKKAATSTKATATCKSKTSTSATPVPAVKQPKTPQAKKAAQADTKTKPATKKPTEVQANSNGTTTNQAIQTPNKPKAEKVPVKKEPKIKKEPTTSSSQATPKQTTTPKIKKEVKCEGTSPPNYEPNDPAIRHITGVYNVFSPQLEDQFPASDGNFRIFLCVDNESRKIWGGFELGPKSGVIIITDDYNDPDAELSFGWRSRDLERGGLDFGRGCFGEIYFFGSGGLGGTFFNLFSEPVGFQASRRPGPLWCGKSAWQFERERDGFVAEAYGR